MIWLLWYLNNQLVKITFNVSIHWQNERRFSKLLSRLVLFEKVIERRDECRIETIKKYNFILLFIYLFSFFNEINHEIIKAIVLKGFCASGYNSFISINVKCKHPIKTPTHESVVFQRTKRCIFQAKFTDLKSIIVYLYSMTVLKINTCVAKIIDRTNEIVLLNLRRERSQNVCVFVQRLVFLSKFLGQSAALTFQGRRLCTVLTPVQPPLKRLSQRY